MKIEPIGDHAVTPTVIMARAREREPRAMLIAYLYKDDDGEDTCHVGHASLAGLKRSEAPWMLAELTAYIQDKMREQPEDA